MRHKNVTVHTDRVTVILPFTWVGALVATAVYALVLYALYEDGFLRRPTVLAYPITFAVATLLWLWYMAKRRIVRTFNAANRSVERKNILWREKMLRFDDVAAVSEVGYKGIVPPGSISGL